MKKHKRFILLVPLIFASLLLFSGCFRHTYSSPCDYPNSKWVYNGEFGTIELEIPSKPGQYRGIVEANEEKIYIDYAFDSKTRSLFIAPITEAEYYEGTNITNTDDLLLRGSFQCSSKKLIVTSSHYSTFFGGSANAWSTEKSEKIELVFIRVE